MLFRSLATCDFNQHPVGAGPYRVTKWEDGQSIRMEAFRDYYDGIPKIKHVLFKIVEDADARVMQLQSGELDVAQITPKAAKKLRKDPNYNIVQMKTADYRAISYNEANGFFKNHPELPNILSYGIDRKAIVKSVLLGEGQVAYSPLQKNQYCDSSMEKFNYQPDKCCALLRKSGWKKNKDGYYEKNGQELAFTIYAMENDAVRVDMAKMCAQQLQKVGVHATAAAKQEIADQIGRASCRERV